MSDLLQKLEALSAKATCFFRGHQWVQSEFIPLNVTRYPYQCQRCRKVHNP
jgi:hypothetical protein